jgi:hypothetical protein
MASITDTKSPKHRFQGAVWLFPINDKIVRLIDKQVFWWAEIAVAHLLIRVEGMILLNVYLH